MFTTQQTRDAVHLLHEAEGGGDGGLHRPSVARRLAQLLVMRALRAGVPLQNTQGSIMSSPMLKHSIVVHLSTMAKGMATHVTLYTYQEYFRGD